MQTYTELERQRQELLDKLKRVDLQCISCPKCSSQFFEEILVNKFQVNHNLVPGQRIPQKANTSGFVLLRCIRCNNLLEPCVTVDERDLLKGDYHEFLDTMDGKGDTRKEKPENQHSLISNEEL